MEAENLSFYNKEEMPSASKMCFGIVVSEGNKEITSIMLKACVDTLLENEALEENIRIKVVPSAFDLVYAAHQMMLRDELDAIIVLGCIIKGETKHAEYICQGVTTSIAQLNTQSTNPIVLGLITAEDKNQALARAGGKRGNKGVQAAVSAIRMVKF